MKMVPKRPADRLRIALLGIKGLDYGPTVSRRS
jgi:hypothetical protein